MCQLINQMKFLVTSQHNHQLSHSSMQYRSSPFAVPLLVDIAVVMGGWGSRRQDSGIGIQLVFLPGLKLYDVMVISLSLPLYLADLLLAAWPGHPQQVSSCLELRYPGFRRSWQLSRHTPQTQAPTSLFLCCLKNENKREQKSHALREGSAWDHGLIDQISVSTLRQFAPYHPQEVTSEAQAADHWFLHLQFLSTSLSQLRVPHIPGICSSHFLVRKKKGLIMHDIVLSTNLIRTIEVHIIT